MRLAKIHPFEEENNNKHYSVIIEWHYINVISGPYLKYDHMIWK